MKSSNSQKQQNNSNKQEKMKIHKEENNIKIKNVLNYKLSSPENSYQFSSVAQSCLTLCEPMVNKGNCHSLKLGI